jgi:hypothetical protein
MRPLFIAHLSNMSGTFPSTLAASMQATTSVRGIFLNSIVLAASWWKAGRLTREATKADFTAAGTPRTEKHADKKFTTPPGHQVSGATQE